MKRKSKQNSSRTPLSQPISSHSSNRQPLKQSAQNPYQGQQFRGSFQNQSTTPIVVTREDLHDQPAHQREQRGQNGSKKSKGPQPRAPSYVVLDEQKMENSRIMQAAGGRRECLDKAALQGLPMLHVTNANRSSRGYPERSITPAQYGGGSERHEDQAQEPMGAGLRDADASDLRKDRARILKKRDEQFQMIKNDLMKKNKEAFLFLNGDEDEIESNQREKLLQKQEEASVTTNMDSMASQRRDQRDDQQAYNHDRAKVEVPPAILEQARREDKTQNQQKNQEEQQVERRPGRPQLQAGQDFKAQLACFDRQMNEILQNSQTAFFGCQDAKVSLGRCLTNLSFRNSHQINDSLNCPRGSAKPGSESAQRPGLPSSLRVETRGSAPDAANSALGSRSSALRTAQTSEAPPYKSPLATGNDRERYNGGHTSCSSRQAYQLNQQLQVGCPPELLRNTSHVDMADSHQNVHRQHALQECSAPCLLRDTSKAKANDLQAVKGITAMEQAVTSPAEPRNGRQGGHGPKLPDPSLLIRTDKNELEPIDMADKARDWSNKERKPANNTSATTSSFGEQLQQFQQEYSAFMESLQDKHRSLSEHLQKLQLGDLRMHKFEQEDAATAQAQARGPPRGQRAVEEAEGDQSPSDDAHQSSETRQYEQQQYSYQTLLNNYSQREHHLSKHPHEQDRVGIMNSAEETAQNVLNNPDGSQAGQTDRSVQQSVPRSTTPQPYPQPHPVLPHPTLEPARAMHQKLNQHVSLNTDSNMSLTIQSAERSLKPTRSVQDASKSTSGAPTAWMDFNQNFSQNNPRSNAEVFTQLLAQTLSFQETVLKPDLEDTLIAGLLSNYQGPIPQLPLLSQEARSFKEIALTLLAQLQLVQDTGSKLKNSYKECLGHLRSLQGAGPDDCEYHRSKDTLTRQETATGQSLNRFGVIGTAGAGLALESRRNDPKGACPLCKHDSKEQERKAANDKVISLAELGELKELRERNLQLIDENKQFQISIQNLDEKCQNLQENNDQLIEKLKSATNRAQNVHEDFLKQQDVVQQSAAQFNQQQQQLMSQVQLVQRTFSQQVTEQMSELNAELSEMTNENQELKKSLDSCETQLQNKEHESKVMQLEIRKLKYALNQQAATKESVATRELKTQLGSLKLQEQEAQDSLDAERQAKEKLVEHNDYLEEKIRDLEAINLKLEQDMANQKRGQEKAAGRRNRDRVLSASLGRACSEMNGVGRGAYAGASSPLNGRAKMYRDRGCQADMVAIDLAQPNAARATRYDHRGSTSLTPTQGVFPSRSTTRHDQPQIELKPSSPGTHHQEAALSDLMNIPEHVINEVKQFYVDNLTRQHSQTVLVDRLTRALKQAKKEIKEAQKEIKEIDKGGANKVAQRRKNLCCSSFDQVNERASALDHDEACQDGSRSGVADKRRSKSYHSQTHMKNASKHFRKSPQSQSILAKTKRRDGDADLGDPKRACNCLQMSGEPGHALSSERTGKDVDFVKGPRSTAFKSSNIRDQRCQHHQRPGYNQPVQSKGRSSSSGSDEGGARTHDDWHDDQGGRLVRWQGHQKKLELIDVLQKEKSLLQCELAQLKKQLDELKNSNHVTIRQLEQQVDDGSQLQHGQKETIKELTQRLEEAKKELERSQARELEVDAVNAEMRELIEQERQTNHQALHEARRQSQMASMKLQQLASCAKSRLVLLSQYLRPQIKVPAGEELEQMQVDELINHIISQLKEHGMVGMVQKQHSELIQDIKQKVRSPAVRNHDHAYSNGRSGESPEGSIYDLRSGPAVVLDHRRRKRSLEDEAAIRCATMSRQAAHKRHRSQHMHQSTKPMTKGASRCKRQSVDEVPRTIMTIGNRNDSNEDGQLYSIEQNSRNTRRRTRPTLEVKYFTKNSDYREQRKYDGCGTRRQRGRDLIDPDRQYVEDEVDCSGADSFPVKQVKKLSPGRESHFDQNRRVLSQSRGDQSLRQVSNRSNRQAEEPIELEQTGRIQSSDRVRDEDILRNRKSLGSQPLQQYLKDNAGRFHDQHRPGADPQQRTGFSGSTLAKDEGEDGDGSNPCATEARPRLLFAADDLYAKSSRQQAPQRDNFERRDSARGEPPSTLQTTLQNKSHITAASAHGAANPQFVLSHGRQYSCEEKSSLHPTSTIYNQHGLSPSYTNQAKPFNEPGDQDFHGGTNINYRQEKIMKSLHARHNSHVLQPISENTNMQSKHQAQHRAQHHTNRERDGDYAASSYGKNQQAGRIAEVYDEKRMSASHQTSAAALAQQPNYDFSSQAPQSEPAEPSDLHFKSKYAADRNLRIQQDCQAFSNKLNKFRQRLQLDNESNEKGHRAVDLEDENNNDYAADQYSRPSRDEAAQARSSLRRINRDLGDNYGKSYDKYGERSRSYERQHHDLNHRSFDNREEGQPSVNRQMY